MSGAVLRTLYIIVIITANLGAILTHFYKEIRSLEELCDIAGATQLEVARSWTQKCLWATFLFPTNINNLEEHWWWLCEKAGSRLEAHEWAVVWRDDLSGTEIGRSQDTTSTCCQPMFTSSPKMPGRLMMTRQTSRELGTKGSRLVRARRALQTILFRFPSGLLRFIPVTVL